MTLTKDNCLDSIWDNTSIKRIAKWDTIKLSRTSRISFRTLTILQLDRVKEYFIKKEISGISIKLCFSQM